MTTWTDHRLHERLVDALLEVPGIGSRNGRDVLLTGIPATIRAILSRADNPFVDMTNVLSQLESLGRLDNGERPVVIVTHNAWRMTQGTELGRRLAELERDLETAYGGDPPSPDLPDRPEVLIFGGTGEWVSTAFLDQARSAGKRVARLRIPRYEHGRFVNPVGAVGTAWLVAPGLLLTNHHVVAARDDNEPAVAESDLHLQVAGAEAWFDYHTEGGTAVRAPVREVAALDARLDYAVLRVPSDAEPGDRRPLTAGRHRPELTRGNRLNIVQCPSGGPLRYAIRNNFFVGPGRGSQHIRYLTDTLQGSSGSPVFDDRWQVIAMHRGHRRVDPSMFEGEPATDGIVKFHNEGILLADILDDLPPAVLTEIQLAQRWD